MELDSVLKALETVNPGNIHVRTNASVGQREDFQSIWSRHTAQAARYYLLPKVLDGSVTLK